MARFWQRTMDLLGLSDDDAFDDGYDDRQTSAVPRRPSAYDDPPMAPAYPPSGTVRPMGQGFDGGVVSISSQAPRASGTGYAPTPPSAQSTSTVRTLSAQPAPKKVHVVNPASFAECKEIGERFRNSEPVIVNLVEADRDLTRRVIDFVSGLAFGLNGDIRKVADKVFMLTPTNVEVSSEDRRKLEERGFRA